VAEIVDVSEEVDEEAAAAAANANAAALAALHKELFGEVGGTDALLPVEDGLPDEATRALTSEMALDEWRRAVSDVPKDLPLPNMTGVCLVGTYGASTHAGGILRLWEGSTGRRLAASPHKLELTALAAHGTCVAVGDASGALHLYSTHADFTPVRLAPTSYGPVRSLALLPLSGAAEGGGGGASDAAGEGVLVVASGGSSGDELTVAVTSPAAWPPPQPLTREAATLLAPLCSGGPVHVAAGPAGCVVGASAAGFATHDLRAGAAVAMADVQKAVSVWSASTPEWHAPRTADDAHDASLIVDGLAKLGLTPASSSAAAATVPAAAASAGASKGGAAAEPCRRVSYSPMWRLLGACTDGDVVTLWDVRSPGARGPAAGVRVAGGASWVHLDEGERMAGQLLVAPASGGPLLVYDVRRVPCARSAGAALPVGALAPPANAPAACFAALGSTLVVGGGAKCGSAWRFCGERADPNKGEEEEDDEERRKPAKEKKKKRMDKKEVRGSRQSRMA
jgi:hypothetical protein